MKPKTFYSWEEQLYHKDRKGISNFQPFFGTKILEKKNNKNNENNEYIVEIKLYVCSKDQELYLIKQNQDFKIKEENKFIDIKKDGTIYLLKTTLSHKEEYLIFNKTTNTYLEDPNCFYFSKTGNSIFWNFDDENTYKQKYKYEYSPTKPVKVLQSDLMGLIYYFFDEKEKKVGSDIPKNKYYEFIAKSGVIEKIKELGFNAIQFLPLAQSIDGDNWKLRYLTVYQNAINNKYGNPDEFSLMIDMFHKNDIMVISDIVFSHSPYEDFKLFNKSNNDAGIHRWKKQDNSELFLDEKTHWGTKRYNFDDELIRRYIVDSALSWIRNYSIDGFRIDNVDGIIRFGKNGEGPERENGRTILREFTNSIYEYKPFAQIFLESHYFYGDNAKMLVAKTDIEKKAIGATAYSSSRLTYFCHTDFMPKSADKINIKRIKDIIDEKEWGCSNSTIADFHNHDAAAGLMAMRATGSYAYDALILNNAELHYHAIGKIKVMEAIISFLMEGRTLDLLQTFLLQSGTFEHDTAIKWYLDMIECNNAVLNYKKEVNHIMDNISFAPVNIVNRKILSCDEEAKVIVCTRENSYTKEDSKYIIVINLGSYMISDYKFYVDDDSKYELIFNSDKMKYAGSGRVSFKKEYEPIKENNNNYIKLEWIAPYNVIVFRRKLD